MKTEDEISDSLPAVYHFGSIQFDDDPDSYLSKNLMQRDCTGCHALGTPITRWTRPAEGWLPTMQRMHGYVANQDEEKMELRAQRLAAAFNGKPLKARPDFSIDPAVHNAKIYEIPLPDVLFPHDMDISHVDGLAYTVDRFGDKMIVTDLLTGASTHYAQPPSSREHVEGYSYTGKSHKPGPHSLALGENNLWYTTNASSTEIGVFDASTRTWKASYVLPDKTAYPHTVRIDKKDNVWFTLAASEQIGKINPKDGQIAIIDLPKANPIGMPAGTSPYGIAISPVDGRIWYARLFADKVGYVDPETQAVVEYDSPVKGPRRLRFDASGKLWLTGYSEGTIAKIVPGEKALHSTQLASTVYVMPEFGEGYTPGPYALAVHPDTQEIWINDTHTDRVYRFNPETEKFSSYPMPLRGTYTRDFAFTKSGWACTANSPIMNAALEGGIAELICIDANANKKTSE